MSPTNAGVPRLKTIPREPGASDGPVEERTIYAVTAALVVLTLVLSTLCALGAVYLVLQR